MDTPAHAPMSAARRNMPSVHSSAPCGGSIVAISELFSTASYQRYQIGFGKILTEGSAGRNMVINNNLGPNGFPRPARAAIPGRGWRFATGNSEHKFAHGPKIEISRQDVNSHFGRPCTIHRIAG